MEVGEQPAEPALVDVRHVAALGPRLDRVACLLLRADEENRAALGGDLRGEAPRLREQLLGLQQVDDVDPVALAVDVATHARIPAARLVAEMDARLQRSLSPGSDIECSLAFVLCSLAPRGDRHRSVPGRAPSDRRGVGYWTGVIVGGAGRLATYGRWSADNSPVHAPYPANPCAATNRAQPRPRALQRRRQVLRQLGVERQSLAREGVVEAQPGAVQELALEVVAARVAVALVAGDGMADRREVGATWCVRRSRAGPRPARRPEGPRAR